MKQPYDQAFIIANDFIKKFVKGEYVIAGSIRRHEELIGDVDIITSDPLIDIEERFKMSLWNVKKINGGKKKMDVDYKGVRFNIYFTQIKSWGAMLFFLTGPANYGIAYRVKAKKKGWHLDQYSLKDETGKVIASKTERSIYKAFGKPYKQPELRGK